MIVLLLWLIPPTQCLIETVEWGILCLFLVLKRDFQNAKVRLARDFFSHDLYQIKEVLFYS